MMHLLVNENVILEESRFTPLVLLLEGFFGQLNSNNDVEFSASNYPIYFDTRVRVISFKHNFSTFLLSMIQIESFLVERYQIT